MKTPIPWWWRWIARFSESPRFRVLYPDGRWSIPMRYSTAEDYAQIFGGEVRWADEFVWQEHRHACPTCKTPFSCGNTSCTAIVELACGECDPVGG